jgi:HAD superfamily hydrolase (TIGR01509 family)
VQNISAVIFDMDGLLLDSERVALATFKEACSQCHFVPDLSIYYRCIGTNANRVQEILSEGYGPDYKAISKIWKARYKAETFDKPVPLKSGADTLLRELEKGGLRRAVVTSTDREIAVRKLTNSRIIQFFDLILGGDQVSLSKPDPDIYLTACRQLDIEPPRGLALEDSDNGVLAAFRAGLRVIQIPDLKPPSPEVLSLGHPVMHTLSEVGEFLKR